MTRIFSAPNEADVYNLKHVLEARGIDCEVRGQHRNVGMGELPPIECWVELWVTDDAMVEPARKLIEEAGEATGPDWTCPSCGEFVEARFDQCWNCQGNRQS